MGKMSVKSVRIALCKAEILAVSMLDSTEKAAGLNEFESLNIRARLSVPEEFVPGEEFQVKLDLTNVGKKPGL
jgi:hypothetical protein